jgi:serine/arginine repetitive matrix protein 2
MQPQRAPPSASASLAATKAFVKDRESNPNLSNAAAAAALRTHVTTPTPVGETVTKRMVRRNSASSNGSSAAQQRPGVLQRQSSSGSMTERTFRSPSPGRGPSPADPNAPPVPSVPKNIPQTSAAHRRASSLDPPYRGGSPAPRGGGRGVSLDRGTGPSPAGRGQRAPSNLAQVPEDDQDAAQRSSVNFSRPMSPASAAKSGWFGGPVINHDAVQRMASTSRPATSSGVASTPVRNIEQSVQNAAQRPVKTHQVARGVEGSRLSSGSMRAKPSGTAVESRSFLQPASRPPPGPVDPKSPDAVFDPSTRTFVHKQDAMARHRELNEEPEQPSQHYVAQHLQEHSPPRVTQQNLAPASRPPPPRTPSPVRHPAHQEESPAVQRREDVSLPRLDTSVNIRRPGDPPTGIPKNIPQSGDSVQAPSLVDSAVVDRHSVEQAKPHREPENTVQPTPIDVLVSPKFAPNQDSAYPRLPPPIAPTTTNTLAGRGHGSVRTEHDRGQSLSPPRNAHFAPVAVELAGVKHQPPPRSISPAKSALKSSPSVSRRGNSPVAQNGRLLSRGTPSEASDTTSDGGSKMKRRSMRVSFEEDPVIAGPSAQVDEETPSSPTGLSASKWSPRTEKEDEFEDFMKPRPALPSFGSIRDKERRSAQDEVPEKVTETVSSTPMSASVGSIGEPLQGSSDHAIGGILANDIAQKQASMNDPLPPEVTSVEGSGYVSDSSDEADRSFGSQKHGAVDDSSQILAPEPKSLTTPPHEDKSSSPSSIKEQVVEVPDIALLPATPSPYEKPEPKFQSLVIPGGWDDEVAEAEDRKLQSDKDPKQSQPPAQASNLHDLVAQDEDSSDDNSSVYSDAYEDLSDAEGGFASIDAVVESPVTSSGLMFSKYADKANSDSPSSSTGSGLRNQTAMDDETEPASTPSKDWDASRQHWSGLAEARKQPQINEPSVGESLHANDTAARVMTAPIVTPAPARQEQVRAERKVEPQHAPVQSKPTAPQSQPAQPASKPLKSALKKSPVAQPAPAVQTQPQIRKTMRDSIPRDDRAPEPQMRTSMRGPPGNNMRSTEPQMRKSMRTPAPASPREQPQMRTSMRGSSPATTTNAGLAASRYSTSYVEQKPARAALQKKHIPATAVAAKPRPQSMPMKAAAPVPTYDSDSDASVSSFQRARGRRAGSQGNRYTMRASMRQEAAPTMRATAPAPKPVRSISPPDSPAPALRKSMRPSSPTPEPPRSSKFSIRSLSPMGRFRSSKPIEAAPPMPTQPRKASGLSKQPKQKAPITERAKPAFKSRFADSSDEDDDGRTPRFQSRFADSDDDEPADYALPPGLAPVRGIPRKSGEEDGDSTDLEEEIDDAPVTAPSKEMGGTAIKGPSNGQTNGNANGQGASLATGSLRDSKHAPLPSFESGGKSKTKRGFFGLGKKKTAPTTNAPAQTTSVSADTPTAPPSEIPLPPQQRNRDQGLPLTPIDEDKDIGNAVQSSPQVTKSPKLQRRSTPEWPLPHNNIPVPPIPEDARPMSSDGIAPRRPRFQVRQSSQMSNVTAPPGDVSGRSVSYGRSGKKKKFQGLRRVFGLND